MPNQARATPNTACLPAEKEKDIVQNMIDSVKNIHLVYLDRDFNFIRVNQAYAATCGYKPEEMVGKNHFDLYPHEENEAIFKSVRDTGVSAQFHDKPFIFPDQPQRGITYWDWTLEPIKNSAGEVTGLLFSLVETTERKKAEEDTNKQRTIQQGATRILEAALKSNKEELGKICLFVAEEVTQSKFGFIGEINPNGLQDIAISNPGWKACSTVTEGGHRRPPGNFKIHGIYGIVLSKGKSFYTNDPEHHPDRIGLPAGHPPLKNFLGVPLKSDQKTIGIIAVANKENGFNDKDLTYLESLAPIIVEAFARKKAEEALKENERTFFELIEGAPFGIYVIDSQFRISQMNKGSQSGAFRNVHPLIGRPFNEAMHILWPDQVAEEIIAHFRHTLETGDPYYSPKFTNPRHDVETVESYEWELHRMKLPNGHFGVICYYFDSTKLREAEQALSKAKDELKNYASNLEHLVEEKTKQLKDSERLATIGATAGMVGHDIRNPLQAITSDLFLLKDELNSFPGYKANKEVAESLEGIERNIDYINKIVADLQDYARPLAPAAHRVNLDALCKEVLSKSVFTKKIKVTCVVEDDVRVIVSDKYLLRRSLSNLASNAVQAMPDGGSLTVHACRQQGDTVITVEDTGVGISEEAKNNLFTPMFTTKSKGQGFGLAVVKRVVETLGGNVTFQSELGKGTKFIIRLPPTQEINGKDTFK